ncbi:MAG: hypothetical protein JWP88_1198 [Flaviaesturariibacter sp.]|nr:hypothetical protein [Flaviaesturariibacter sp.]
MKPLVASPVVLHSKNIFKNLFNAIQSRAYKRVTRRCLLNEYSILNHIGFAKAHFVKG